ncbi:type IV toxin-antitoxin system AbiEi family antitoxin domain-containing protein, partial [Komagataeibacter kakiaceti]|uniref:type IV toxin-antitoxin system AbiEi family antitoxin domain-containing protein n=1 Tax=Komagataeibacter kakiaceti TaxID=943261 RepID=UPI0038995F9F
MHPPTISRAVTDGTLIRITRGLYQRVDGEPSAEQSARRIIEASAKGVIALTSALAVHVVTDQMPRKVWVVINPRDCLLGQASCRSATGATSSLASSSRVFPLASLRPTA